MVGCHWVKIRTTRFAASCKARLSANLSLLDQYIGTVVGLFH